MLPVVLLDELGLPDPLARLCPFAMPVTTRPYAKQKSAVAVKNDRFIATPQMPGKFATKLICVFVGTIDKSRPAYGGSKRTG
jgi:hypothetical protein